ncbi:spliced leader RNA PSE-promoter transcription factor [Novymonas esmeraldas]|uniref:Spliced leader RNA PSE-promoter transcription factor n=1 Tax=Novymonas esmeraldas TaxID=1808958 RepID=A0AAW0F4Q0_9TRYP
MRRSLVWCCSKIDLDGKPSRYFPRFRPRRLVMPVDTNNVHNNNRHVNPLYVKVQEQQRRRRRAEKRGAVQLASVPRERSVGDVYRILMETCTAQDLFSNAALTPPAVRELEALVTARQSAGAPVEDQRHASPLYSRAFPAAPPPPPLVAASSSPAAGHALTVREVDEMWSMLDRTPLNAPVHGALALRGDALVRSTLLELAYSAYPRLRSKHVQQLLHETTGLLPCGRIAMRIGLAEHCGVEGDIAMWRELNVLSERVRLARKAATVHLQRVEKGVAAQRRWYWRAVLRSAAARLRLFPVHKEDLQPRLEWVRSSLLAFVAFVEMAEASGDPRARVRPLIHHLFASQLTRHVRRHEVVAAAEAVVEATAAGAGAAHAGAGGAAAHDAADHVALSHRVAEELARVKARTADEEEVLEGRVHPMNRRADLRREQFESSGGAHGTQMLRDDSLERHAEDHRHLAPPLLLHALASASTNAFKEVQLVLRYGSGVSEHLRQAPLDVDQAVRRVIDLQETNNYASLHDVQQLRQVEHTVCRLYAGRHCLGEGKGETLMTAMQDASIQMLTRYYLHPPTPSPSSSSSAAVAGTRSSLDGDDDTDVGEEGNGSCGDGTETAGIPAPRMRPLRTEEEVIL